MSGTKDGRGGDARPAMASGRVALVGAGPGDPELWTRRAVRLLQEADLVLYDALVDEQALRGLTSAQLTFVGKRAGQRCSKQDTIHDLMIRAALEGKRVVRFQGGDPFLLGRGGEEALALAEAGVPFEVVPGVTSAVAAPGLAGIPVTHRGTSSAVLVVSGHTTDALDSTLGTVRPNAVTVVVLMGLARRGTVADQLCRNGWSPDTPAAIVCAASTPDAWMWTGPLRDLADAQPPAGLAGVLVVGDVVELRAAVAAASEVRQEPKVGEVMYGRN